MAALSILCERLVFHPLRNAPVLHDMIAAIGLMLFLEAGAQAIFGADFLRMPTPYAQVISVLGVTTQVQRLLIIVAGGVLVVLSAAMRQKNPWHGFLLSFFTPYISIWRKFSEHLKDLVHGHCKI